MAVTGKSIAVCGAGFMGLTAAYELAKRGHRVTVFEKDDRVGGMSACFDFDGLQIERYYHFICKPDQPLFELLDELELSARLKWRPTRMGFFYRGRLFDWGTPWALLRFPHLDLWSKVRFGLQVFGCVHRERWDKLDCLPAREWIVKTVGERAYEVLWHSLLDLKFHRHRDRVSAAWVGRRLKRMGLSRKNPWTEELGYLEGGMACLLDALVARLEALGGTVRLDSAVTAVTRRDRGPAVTVNGIETVFDEVITTFPLPHVPRVVQGLPPGVVRRYESLDNIGVVCVILKLRHSLTCNFWLNINDPRVELPGVIEFSNINPLPDKIVYLPFYLPHDHGNFTLSDEELLEKAVAYCKMINPAFAGDWVKAWRVHRDQYAQPICPPGFADLLPPMQTAVPGVYAADTSYCYPEDRSVAGSILVGRQLADLAHPPNHSTPQAQ